MYNNSNNNTNNEACRIEIIPQKYIKEMDKYGNLHLMIGASRSKKSHTSKINYYSHPPHSGYLTNYIHTFFRVLYRNP